MSSGEASYFGLFDDVQGHHPHPLLIEDFESDEDVGLRVPNIYAPTIDGTELHRAVRRGDQVKVEELLKLYEEDFDKVKACLVSRYRWDLTDRIWLDKTILVANSEQQCRNSIALDCKVVDLDDLRRAVFVLLQKPVNDECIAVIQPNESNRLEVAQLIETLIPNGFLTWNYTGARGTSETFMEVAASCGAISVMKQLYDLGVKLALPGHNPLVQACRRNRREVIDWLLIDHFDHFDCTLRDCNQYNAFAAVMQHDNVGLVTLILDKMMAYRQKDFNETERQAFSEIFRFESRDAPFVSIFSLIGSDSIQRLVEDAIVRYRLDLSYQSKNFSVLLQLLNQKIAIEYCLQQIRSQPSLLKLQTYEEHTALHQLLQDGHLKFLNEIYQDHPAVKSYFNTDGAFKLLKWLFWNKHHQTIEFVLTHHLEFLRRDEVKLQEVLRYYKNDFSNFPELSSLAGNQNDVIQIDLTDTILFAPPPLYHAVRTDDLALVSGLLESGNDLNTLDHGENHAIHHVQSPSMLTLLLERHLDGLNLIYRTNSMGCTVLHQICSLEGEQAGEMLEMVIKAGADVHLLTNDGESALFFVRSCAVFDILMKHDLQLDMVSNAGETPLQRILGNLPNVAKVMFPLMLKLPSFRNHAHKYLTAMTSYCTRSFFNFHFRDLLDQNPDTTKLMFDSIYRTSPEKASKLFAEACNRALNYVVEKFLDFDYELNYNYHNENLNTPLSGLLSYIEEPNVTLVQRLLKKNVDLNVQNICGRTALHLFVQNFQKAKLHGHGTNTVQLLISMGSLVNTADYKGNTALHLAFQQRDWELVDVLIRHGADSGLENRKGKTPAQMLSTVDQELFYFWS